MAAVTNKECRRNTMAMIRDLREEEKPREKAFQYGIRSLNSTELLAVLLRTGIRGQSVLATSEKLLDRAGGISGLARMDVRELMETEGIGTAKAVELTAAFELSRRIAWEEVRKQQISSPESVVRWLQSEIGSAMQEQFLVIYLDQQHRILSYRILFVGTINESGVYPREIFRQALLENSTDLMLVHNHPSGDITPSRADRAVTRHLWEAGLLMGIRVLDHIIVSDRHFFSFAGQGILEEFMEEDGNQW